MKAILSIGVILLFFGCSQKDYESMYYENINIFAIHPHSSAKDNYEAIKKGEDPTRKPSYKEYREENDAEETLNL